MTAPHDTKHTPHHTPGGTLGILIRKGGHFQLHRNHLVVWNDRVSMSIPRLR